MSLASQYLTQGRVVSDMKRTTVMTIMIALRRRHKRTNVRVYLCLMTAELLGHTGSIRQVQVMRNRSNVAFATGTETSAHEICCTSSKVAFDLMYMHIHLGIWMMYRFGDGHTESDPRINPWNPLGREMDALTVAWVDVPFPLGPFVQGLTNLSDGTSRV